MLHEVPALKANGHGHGGVKDGGPKAVNVSEGMISAGIGLYALLASDTTYSSFVIELWNDSGFVAETGELSMSNNLADYIVKNNSMTLPTAWVGSSYAIPEPNSAMLMLLGLAALGLRRRRRAA